MPTWFARIVACFVFPRERRRAFREKHCAKKETPVERLERKIDLLTRAFLLEKTAPGATDALCPPLELSSETRKLLRDQLWANLGENGTLRRAMIARQTELLRELVYVLPESEIVPRLLALSALCRDDAMRLETADALSWVFRRREKYAEAAETLAPLFERGTPLSARLLRRLAVCELRRGNAARAEAATREHLQRFGTRDLWRQCDLAELAAHCGAEGDSEIRAAAKLSERARKNIDEKFFENFLRGKRVAVVGNGPQETGRGNGEKIDAYDVVVRFNDFPEDERFRRDYGAKTDVWVCACWTKTPWRERVPVVVAGDIFYSDEYPNAGDGRRAAGTPQTVLAFPPDLVRENLAENGVKLPTLGALMLAWIKSIRPEFSADDVFGFSFKESIPTKKLEHYYRTEATKNGTIHNLDEERAFLRRLFGMEGE